MVWVLFTVCEGISTIRMFKRLLFRVQDRLISVVSCPVETPSATVYFPFPTESRTKVLGPGPHSCRLPGVGRGQGGELDETGRFRYLSGT